MYARIITNTLTLSLTLCALVTVIPSRADQVTQEQRTETIQESQTTPAMSSVTTTVSRKDQIASLQIRLDRMRQQIDLGLQKGWLTSDAGNNLKTQAAQLTSRVEDMSRQGYDQSQANDIERQANLLNKSIADTMGSK